MNKYVIIDIEYCINTSLAISVIAVYIKTGDLENYVQSSLVDLFKHATIKGNTWIKNTKHTKK